MKRTLALVALCAVIMSIGAYADGMIIPEPVPDFPRPEYLEVEYHHVDVSIDNQFTETKIDQIFHNPNYWDIEGTYLFPLPEGASIQKFSMYVDDEELQGEILEADEAREIYEDLVRKLIDPGLLEYVDRNTFKARVYPIEGNSDKRVKMDYSEVISCESGICEYIYPLDIERFSSKPMEEVVINVVLESNVPIKSVYSPTHEVEITRMSDYRVEVSYEAEDVKPDKDFKLIYAVSDDDIGVNLITHKEGETGYFLLMLAPKFQLDEGDVIEKDVVFVLDKSGSMSGDKIEQAKEALKFTLNSLNEGDRFGLVTFSTGVTAYKDAMEPAGSGNIADAVDFVDGIEALGGTDIHGGLLEALGMLPSDDRPKIIIFLTDGEPTVGITDINEILGDVAAENENAKIFVFGVGYDVNTHLLDKLSIQNHGVSEYVVEDESIEEKVSRFYEKVDNPVLSDISIGFDGVRVKEMYPKELPDIFKGTQILVFGQYTGSGQTTLSLRGEISGVKNTLRYGAYLPSERSDNDFLPRLWATRKIGYLLDEIRLEGEGDELIEEIVELSKRYGIATPYTSFLILEDEPAGDWRRELQESLAPQAGFDAVTASQDIGSYKGANAAGEAEETVYDSEGRAVTIRHVGKKTFIEKDGIMTDTEYEEGDVTLNLKYGSEAYFDTLAANPGLGQYFAVGKNIIACVGGTCIKVDESYAGAEDAIGDLGMGEEEPGWQCAVDSDCELSCACTCGEPGSIQCIRQADCPEEQGITGCECVDGACAPVRDPGWEPPGGQGEVCGDGVCDDPETPASCPADCEAGPAEMPTRGEGQDFTSLVVMVAVVIVLLSIAVSIKRITGKNKSRE